MTTIDPEGKELVWTAHYWQHGHQDSDEFDSPEAAFDYLGHGEAYGTLAGDHITGPDGSVLVDRDTLRGFTGPDDFAEWLGKRQAIGIQLSKEVESPRSVQAQEEAVRAAIEPDLDPLRFELRQAELRLEVPHNVSRDLAQWEAEGRGVPPGLAPRVLATNAVGGREYGWFWTETIDPTGHTREVWLTDGPHAGATRMVNVNARSFVDKSLPGGFDREPVRYQVGKLASGVWVAWCGTAPDAPMSLCWAADRRPASAGPTGERLA